MSSTSEPRLGARFHDALVYAAEKHRTQVRKASGVPYVGHLLSVAGLVIEAGGTETQAIAALLHDAAEDQGGAATLADIKERFGPAVARIVDECSDTLEDPKPPWRERKQNYVAHLDGVSDEALLVSLADKVDNVRALLRDFRVHGAELWERFSVQDPQAHLWYYRALLAVYQRRLDNWLVDELRRAFGALETLVV